MENTFVSERFEATRKNRYLLKKLKNKYSREFINIYTSYDGEINDKLKKIACLYDIVHKGSLNVHIFDSDMEKMSNEHIQQIYLNIKQNADKNFKYFYESYIRKIEKGYEQEYIQNALDDLKNAYYTYRKVNNPSWNLEDYQITESEIKNLYNILIPSSGEKDSDKKELEEKQ